MCTTVSIIHLPSPSQQTEHQDLSLAVHANDLLPPQLPLHPALLLLSSEKLSRAPQLFSNLVNFTDKTRPHSLAHVEYLINIDESLAVGGREPGPEDADVFVQPEVEDEV